MWVDIFEHRAVIQDVLAWLICLAAIYWGGGPERILGACWLLLFEITDPIYHQLSNNGITLADVDLFHASLDVVMMAVMIGVAVNANRIYPLWMAALQILAAMSHFARGLADEISPIAYAIMFMGPSYFQILVLLVGIIKHRQRQAKYGPYRDWRQSKSKEKEPFPLPVGVIDSSTSKHNQIPPDDLRENNRTA